MKKGMKRLALLLTASIVASSAATIAGTTAMAEKKDFLNIWTRNGVGTSVGGQGGAAYTEGVFVDHLWDTGSPATGGAIANRTKDGIYLGYIGAATTTHYAANVDPSNGAEPLGKNRYRLMPFIDSGSGASVATAVSKDTAHAFSEYVNDFENTKITLDMLKGSSYSTANFMPHIQSFRLGLAYMDYDHPVTAYEGSTVYYTDIAWYDITSDVVALKGYAGGTAWKDLKTEVTVKVSDILAADHVRINGATAADCTVTAENANAFVLGIEFKDGDDTFAATGHQLYFDNINIMAEGAEPTEAPTPEPTPVPTEAPAPTLAPGTKLMIDTSYEKEYSDVLYDGVWGYRNYNWGSTLYTETVGAATVSSDDRQAFTLNPTKVGLSTLTEATAPAGVTPIEVSRYRMIPLLTYGNGSVAPTSAHTFMEKIPDFGAEDQYLSVDMLKMGGYTNIPADKVSKYKIGLAFIDYEKGGVISSGSNKVYPTDIAWYDITDEVLALNYRNTSKTWDEQKKTISVKVSDILESTDHQYIHGEPGDLTADNANAVVFGMEMADTTWFKGSNKALAFDDLRIDTPVFDIKGSIAEGVTVTAYNPDEAVSAVIVTAFYKEGKLVDIKIDKDFKADAGRVLEKKYTIASDQAYDSVTVMALDSIDNLKPLCPKFSESK